MGTLVDLTASFHFHHPVSHTNMGLNILRRIRRWLQLFPKRCHKDSQRSNIVFPTPSPDVLSDKGVGQHLAHIL